MLTIAIKDLEIYFSNSNFLQEKTAMYFESKPEKRKADKQTTSALYYKY